MAPEEAYYLIGTMSDWAINPAYELTVNDDAEGEYFIGDVALLANDELKVVSSANIWYPDGIDNNYVITHDGVYTVYFRPNGDGGSDWHYGVLYVADNTPEVKNGIIDGVYYVDDVPTYAGLIEIDGDYYYAGARGVIFRDGAMTVYSGYTNGLLPRGEYTFDADGRIVFPEDGTGIVGDVYYENYAPKNAGLVLFNDDYYFTMTGGKLFKDGVKTLFSTNTNGLLNAGEYTFDADGKIVFPEGGTGVVGNIYYEDYAPKNANLVQVGNDYYLAEGGGRIFKDGVRTLYSTNTNGLLAAGEYTFDADGKIVFPEGGTGIVGNIYYENYAPKSAGVVKFDGNYYLAEGGGRIFKNGAKNIFWSNNNMMLQAGEYTFDADGKITDAEGREIILLIY